MSALAHPGLDPAVPVLDELDERRAVDRFLRAGRVACRLADGQRHLAYAHALHLAPGCQHLLHGVVLGLGLCHGLPPLPAAQSRWWWTRAAGVAARGLVGQ